MMAKIRVIFILSSMILCIALPSCDSKLDKDGGYFDEETQTYRYVRPRVSKGSQQIADPRDGQRQNITGTVVKIDEDAKAFWLRMEERKPYMMLASVMSTQNREDKSMDIRIFLANVSPPGSVTQSSKLRAQWKEYVSRVLASELINQKIVVEATYSNATRRFTGTVYTTKQTKDGRVTQDLNLWMIKQGFSFYFVDQGVAPDDESYREAQKFASAKKLGIWKYY